MDDDVDDDDDDDDDVSDDDDDDDTGINPYQFTNSAVQEVRIWLGFGSWR